MNRSKISLYLKKFLNFFKKVPSVIYKVLLAATIGIILTTYKFDQIEYLLFDLRTQIKTTLGIKTVNNPSVVIIYSNTDTISKYNGYPDFNVHTKLLNKLVGIKNSTIVYNYKNKNGAFIEIDGSTESQSNFSKYATSFNNIYFITYDLQLKGQEANLKLKPPLDKLNLISGPKTNDQKFNSKNPISRRLLINYEGQQLIHHKIASLYNGDISDKQNVNGLFEYIGTEQVFINFQPKNTFAAFRFEEVLDNSFDTTQLENKIIVIGTNANKSLDDYVATPFSGETADMITTSELHANMFQTLIDNSAPIKTHHVINIIITTLISILTVYVALSIKPSIGIAILLATFLGLILISTALLAFFNIWISLAHPLLTIFLCYYFFIPYRLIIENRRSWEYIQKNKLLQQVEELKTNFISMMSHDLKTPIARIQGMTEVILQDPVQLSSVQREAVDTVKSSSDDLLRFINSILQYGRIESQGVDLHKQSKDINQLLQDVIKKHEFLAKVKKIKLQTELEPMFPIQIDVDLMKQVFSNLVENAIKYSHEESSVTIKSREEGAEVIIDIIDNGMGIPAEDLPHIFMKFYRSQSVKTSTIKGSGLGLYLAQYFTQLHKGEITVTSTVGEGSCFTVRLPS